MNGGGGAGGPGVPNPFSSCSHGNIRCGLCMVADELRRIADLMAQDAKERKVQVRLEEQMRVLRRATE